MCFVSVLLTMQLNFLDTHKVGMKADQENSKNSAKEISSSELETSEGSVY